MEEKENIDRYRTMLFSIAYNMLGVIADAEDMVQESYASWVESDKSHVKNVKFYLIRTISNKCLDHLAKIKKEREAYTGTWLPEPVLSPLDTDTADVKSNLSFGFMYLLEKLTPIERGVIILREAFDLSYPEISNIFGITIGNVRQHFSRAKKKLLHQKSKFRVDTLEHEKILRKFIEACINKNLEELIELLHEDVTAYADGGGKAPAIGKPQSGKSNIMKLLVGGMQRYKSSYKMEVLTVNGLSCASFYRCNEMKTPEALIAIDIDENNRIIGIYYMVNPDKLKKLY